MVAYAAGNHYHSRSTGNRISYLVDAMIVIYMAHPYGGNQDNIEKAKQWLRWLNENVAGACFIAPWIQECDGVEETPDGRDAGLARMQAIISKCDAVVAISGISPGVRIELGAMDLGRRWLFPGELIPASGDDFLSSLVEIGAESLTVNPKDIGGSAWRLKHGEAGKDPF